MKNEKFNLFFEFIFQIDIIVCGNNIYRAKNAMQQFYLPN